MPDTTNVAGMARRRRPAAPHAVPVPDRGHAWTLPRATAFAGDPTLDNPVELVRLLTRFPDIRDRLIARTTPAYHSGRRRMPGQWALVYLLFVISGEIDMQPFHTGLSREAWELCGFVEVPDYQTLYLRFCELEAERFRSAFEEAANTLIRRAIAHDRKIGRHVHVDGTAYHSAAVLEHCCPDRARCRAIGGYRPKHLRKT